ncbi:disease resistance protein At4g27190-like isoform X2 [Apium graveolens]|uniref:disease resistance protein At4g27190-like isoform X2 n=1 Tax=Apium graveolens TaxID=4045 RepID=UPI003D7A4744
MALAVIATAFSGLQAVANLAQARAQLYGPIPQEQDNVLKKPDRVLKVSAPNINGLKTLEEPLEETCSFLTQAWNVKGIEIHGKLGTGKTTIMQNLNNHELVAKIYDIVIWLNVSSDGPDTINEGGNFSIEKLQKDVMNRLNLDLAIPVDQYRNQIKKTLQNTKYLLLLDNVKAALSLDEIGFPENWEEKRSKVVFTTRFKGVWRSMTDRSVEVNLLKMNEARTVFSNILKSSGSSIEMNYINQAVKHCGLLVGAIKIVADYLKFESDERTLKDKLEALITWPRDGDNMITDISRTIGFCCKDLTIEQRGCFYYGALYPEEGKIYKDHLLDCWMAENNFVETKAHWRNLLKHLNDRNLFEEDECKKYVRMHKLFRLLALYNLQTDGRHICLVPSPEVSSNQQDKDSWEGKHWISLADNNNLKPFLDSPGCSKLSTLFLQGNSKFTKFPDSFFNKIGSLCVLDLMGTSIESLPDSLEMSKELAVLYLNECAKLLNLPSVLEKLALLRVLDISGSGFKEVPQQIKKLKNLKRLVVSSSAISGTKNMSEVLSELIELQEILIDTKSKKETFDWKIINGVTKSVKTLTSLRLRFVNDEVVDIWEVENGVRKFFGYQILIDAELDILFQRYVEYYSGGEPSSTVVKLLSMSDAIVIAKGDDLESLQKFFFSNFSAILVEDCKKIKYIFGPVAILSNLKKLYLNEMEELESVTSGKFSLANFRELETLKLSRCLQLINLITADAVVDKEEMLSGIGHEYVVFPKLKKLVLVDMPKLESIWKDHLLEFPALTEVEISNCPAMKHFPISHRNSNDLKIITTERTWWTALQWEDNAAKNHFNSIYCSSLTGR